MPPRRAPLEFHAYTIDDHNAPNHCEMCNEYVPDVGSRREHMQKTSHLTCPLCNEYVTVGGHYMHCCDKHASDFWNDHHVAYQDTLDNGGAKPWVTEERERLTAEMSARARKRKAELVRKREERKLAREAEGVPAGGGKKSSWPKKAKGSRSGKVRGSQPVKVRRNPPRKVRAES